MSTPSHRAVRLPLLLTLGAALWFLAVLMFRFLGPVVLIPGSPLLPLLFVVFIPVAWVFLQVGLRLSRARGPEMLTASAIMSATALLLDGLALTFLPGLYGLEAAQLLLVATTLLWGVGWILFFGYAQSRRAA